MWILFAIFLAISFLFSGMEAGLLSVNRVRLRHFAGQGSRTAIRLQKLLKQPAQIIAIVLVVTNLMNISAVVILARECVLRWGGTGYVVALAFALPVFILFGEMLPKALFRRFPYRLLAGFFPILWIVHLLLSPLMDWAGVLASKFAPRRAVRRSDQLFAVPQIKILTAESERFGVFTGTERRLIDGVIDFRGIKARDIMIPMSAVVHVTPETTVARALELARSGGIDRLPVLSPEGVFVGVVTLKDVLLDPTLPKRVSSCMRRIVEIRPTARGYSVLRILRMERVSLAAVVDAAGKPLGVISLADTMKRLVSSAASPSGSNTSPTV